MIVLNSSLIIIKFQNVIVQPYSKAFEFWINPPAKIYRKYYLFDIRNPLEVEQGIDKPFLVERGPYVYSEVWEKRNIKFLGFEYVSYTPVVTLHFEESLSVGSENDNITFLNVPAMVINFLNILKLYNSKLYFLFLKRV